MQFDSYCSVCMLNREFKTAHKYLTPEQANDYIRKAMYIMSTAPKDVSAPYLIPLLRDLLQKYGVEGDTYAKEKKDSNDYVLAVLPRVQEIVDAAEDPLLTALKYAQVGNFLDFGVLSKDDVDAKIGEAIENAPKQILDEREYRSFVSDIEKAKSLLIIGDNAGEIAFDTVLVKQLKKQFPNLSITYSVRGGNCLNDATREDAAYVGMDRLVPVIDNGTRISGTELKYIGQELRDAMERADVILSKGQANFETLAMSGYNIYYNFLAKCERLCKILNVPLFTGMFLAERRLQGITPFPK